MNVTHDETDSANNYIDLQGQHFNCPRIEADGETLTIKNGTKKKTVKQTTFFSSFLSSLRFLDVQFFFYGA